MPSIRNFSGGVLNQVLSNKDSGAGILFDCKNVVSSWNGELRKRTGTAWLMSLPDYARAIPYRLPSGDDIILLLGDNKISGYELVDGENVQPYYIYSGARPSFPSSNWNGRTTNGDYTIFLDGTTSSESTWGKGFDANSTGKYYGNGSLWTGGYRPTTNTEAYIQISSVNPQIFESAIIRWTYSCNGDRPGVYKGWIAPTLQYSDDGVSWTSVKTQVSNPMPTGGDEIYHSSYHYDNRTENYTLYKVTNLDHAVVHKYWRVYCALRITNSQTVDGERIELNVSSVQYLSTSKAPLEIDTSDSFAINKDNIDSIKFAQNGTLMILTNGVNQPFKLEYASGNITSGTFAIAYDENPGSPSCVAFYQNRLWLSGYSAHPTRVCGSAFGHPEDFKLVPVSSTSAISADAVEIQSVIENIWGGNDALYCLSEDGVSMIDARGGIVATEQIEFKLRNREPVNSMTPTYKDDIMIYLGRDKKKILVTDFDYVVQRFKAQIISDSYMDFLAGKVRELHYVPDQSSYVYGILENGKGFILLFDVERGNNAIFPFDTNGDLWDIQPIKKGDNTYLIIVAQRNGTFMLESKLPADEQKIMDFMSEEEKTEYTDNIIGLKNSYLDCCIRREYNQPVGKVSNIPYSPQTVVSVIGDGKLLGNYTVGEPTESTLFAWENDSDIVYTDTDSPSTQNYLFNSNWGRKEGYSINSVNENSITVSHERQEYINFLGYNYVAQINILPAAGYEGTFDRYNTADKIIQYTTSSGRTVSARAFGWKQDNLIIYTLQSSPNAGDRWIIENTYIGSSSTIDTVTIPENVFVKEAELSVGLEVFDSETHSVGSISQVLEDITYSSVVYQAFVANGKTYQRATVVDFVETKISIVTDEYVRNGTQDISTYQQEIELDTDVSSVVIGYPYDSYAVIKFVSPYNLRKFPKEISVNFINSGYIELGNTFETLKPCLNNLVENVILNNKPILLNGNYTMTFDKHAFETPYVIVRSDKGLPFIITGMDYKVDTSNYQGGI